MTDHNGHTCRICGMKTDSEYMVYDRRHKNGEQFLYVGCENCGTLQLDEIPEDIGRFYDSGYEAHSIKTVQNKKNAALRKIVMKLILRGNLPHSIFTMLQQKSRGYTCLYGLKLDYDSKILDVGCGAGGWLYSLALCGFKDLTGVDLYAPDNNADDSISFIHGDIYDGALGKYDLIAMHHSFEHMSDPDSVLKRATELLNENAEIIIRIPLWKSKAWDLFGTNWYQIDAPVHFFLYTEQSMQLLCERNGLKIEKVVYDSAPGQFEISEYYSATENTYNEIRELIKKNGHKKKWKKMTQQVNENGKGDQAVFYIRKAKD